MEGLTKYTIGGWIYGGVVSLVAAAIFAGAVVGLRWVVYRARQWSANSRRNDQRDRMIKIFVYRKYVGKKTIQALARGEFVVIAHAMRCALAGLALVALGVITDWLLSLIPIPDSSMHLATYLLVVLAMGFWIEGLMWLNPQWAKESIKDIDEGALTAAAEVLGESAEDVRKQVG